MDKPMEENFKYEYQLLSRCKSDCAYFLGNGNRNEKYLWAGSVAAQIGKMRELYAAVPVKPEWLTEEAINEYEQLMSEEFAEAYKNINSVCGKYGYTHCDKCPLYSACNVFAEDGELPTDFDRRWLMAMWKAYKQLT